MTKVSFKELVQEDQMTLFAGHLLHLPMIQEKVRRFRNG